jgi:hypothetical protein
MNHFLSSLYPWTTTDEIDFLDGLGHYRQTGYHRDELPIDDVAALLTAYLVGAKTRADWGRVNKVAVIRHAEALLAEVEAQRRRPL